eukprot:TRINITY_DN34788_c0_g1_i2.p1 TRINITY_DN34788_c0_g1~~TRINITY_DN34788_c0_g1_i2.p1  ORF type:complete len:333 (-),score=49.34 TRINITY_DN34788_c0_g1_i2:74-973(-)
MAEHDTMDSIKGMFAAAFGAEGGGAWYMDWKLWVGVVTYASVWSRWLVLGMDYSFVSKAIHCFGADLVILHFLQYFGAAGGLEVLFCFIGMQAIGTAVLFYRPTDLLKTGKFVSVSSYSNFAGSFLQATWHFAGQLIFMAFYFYSLYKNYGDTDGAEYLFWFAGYVSVQMTLYYNRGADSQLGQLWDVSGHVYIYQNIQQLEFSTELYGQKVEPFQLSKMEFIVRSLYGFLINMLVRDLIGFSVPILLMAFHDPMNCVIYSIAVNFIVSMDDSSEVDFKVTKKEERQDLEAGSLLNTSP